jgi:hypothetical protein
MTFNIPQTKPGFTLAVNPFHPTDQCDPTDQSDQQCIALAAKNGERRGSRGNHVFFSGCFFSV